LNNSLTDFAHSSLDITGVDQKYDILRQFSTTVAFGALWRRNETIYRKSKTDLWGDNERPSFVPQTRCRAPLGLD